MQHIYIQSIEISDSRAEEHCPELIVGAGTATTADVTDWTITCFCSASLCVRVRLSPPVSPPQTDAWSTGSFKTRRCDDLTCCGEETSRPNMWNKGPELSVQAHLLPAAEQPS